MGFPVICRLHRLSAGSAVRRLFSNFARGWPGVGLLVMRVVVSICIIANSLAILRIQGLAEGALARSVLLLLGLLIVVGLWTPIASGLVVIVLLWHTFSEPQDRLVSILIATLAASLALLGPGAWSIDARLFGLKQIEIPKRKS